MRRSVCFSRPHFPRSLSLGALALCLMLAACAGTDSTTATVSAGDRIPDPQGGTYTDVSVAYDACMARCNENNPLGFLTREGCFRGCAEARRQVFLRGTSFSGTGECYSAMSELELNRDLYIENMQLWCETEWAHLHKAAGCRDAMAVFYGALTTANLCSGSAPAAVHSTTTGMTPAPVEPLPKGTYTAPPAYVPAPYAPAQVPAPTAQPAIVDTPKYQTPRPKTQQTGAAQTVAPKPVIVPKPEAPKPGASSVSSPAQASDPKQAQPQTPEKDTPMVPVATEKPVKTTPSPVQTTKLEQTAPVSAGAGSSAPTVQPTPAGPADVTGTPGRPGQSDAATRITQPVQPAQPGTSTGQSPSAPAPAASPAPAGPAATPASPTSATSPTPAAAVPLWSPVQPSPAPGGGTTP